MEYIDTHSHFNLSQFQSDREESILRMESFGVGTLCVGVDYQTSLVALALAQKYSSIWAVVGQHPTDTREDFSPERYRTLAGDSRTVSIGECGLDYYRTSDRETKEKQASLFREHIVLASECGLPLMLHIRPSEGSMDAYDDALGILREYKKTYPEIVGTAHFFVGDERIAQEFIDIGFYLSFSGIVTIFPEYESVVRFVPLDRVLAETDAPYAAPLPWRGKRCQPEYVIEVVKKIADLKNLPPTQVVTKLAENTLRLFPKISL